MFKKISMLAAAVTLVMGTAATAATISFSATPTTATANPLGTLISGAFDQNVSDPGLISGVRRSPWEGTALDGSVYSAVTGSASYAFSSLQKQFSLVWGSPDTYNALNFYKGAALVKTVTGSDVTAVFGANIATSLINISGFGQFDSVEFVSGQPAFEYANISVAAVPVPAAGLMLLGALGGLGALRRRKIAA